MEATQRDLPIADSTPAEVDILVGIASYNNADTIAHVVKAVNAGLAKYYPGKRAIIVNSDGGSEDGTAEVVREAHSVLDHSSLMLEAPEKPVHHISIPYTGVSGKGSAFRAIFAKAVELKAKACCVVDADLRSITPEWIDLLITPVMKEGFDFVAPLYNRHKFDGTITNSIIYPVTRALYGHNLRQPIGGDFGFSGALAKFYLDQDVWDTHVARFGIDIWMTTEAITNNFKVCQTFLGAKIHDPKDPGESLSDMLVQVVVTLFTLMKRHSGVWKSVSETREVPTFGFKYHVGLEPVTVNVERLLDAFRTGIQEHAGLWERILWTNDLTEILSLGKQDTSEFNFPAPLWTRVIYDYAAAYHDNLMPSDELITSLIPLYLARTASFIIEVKDKDQAGAEAEIELLCLEFEKNKGYLVDNWRCCGKHENCSSGACSCRG
jgi:glycosyltransferase involved in cell wall biosynthesis